MSNKKKVVIIGAGPAGLTAAYELATQSDKKITVIEMDSQVGGISKTVDYKGNKIDIGGHRFFSKSDWVIDWWNQFLPTHLEENSVLTTYQNQTSEIHGTNNVVDSSAPHMMVRPRKSRIYYQKKLFDYPIKLNLETLLKLGVWKSTRIFFSLIKSRLKPISTENNLEDFYINRFGKELYQTFFKEYTHKVWGKECHEISAEWGKQRIKELSFRKIVKHYLNTLFYPSNQKFGNKQVEQSLTEYFLYPQKGPGQLWEEVAKKCQEKGVTFLMQHEVIEFSHVNGSIVNLTVKNSVDSSNTILNADLFISTMPVKNLIDGLGNSVPSDIKKVGLDLEYRDFLIVGLLLDEIELEKVRREKLDDNWLYIQDLGVQVGRVQLFHNWSPFMVQKEDTYWIGAEYFCQKGDELWTKPDSALQQLASKELATIGLINPEKVQDSTVVRMPKAYPSYVGSYRNFDMVRDYLDSYDNLYLIGRNGTHKYNNQDHSMLMARRVVETILSSTPDHKESIWEVNMEREYHETK